MKKKGVLENKKGIKKVIMEESRSKEQYLNNMADLSEIIDRMQQKQERIESDIQKSDDP